MPYTFKYGDRPLEGVTVQRAVGRGGFGEVYYALTDSGKQVALKYLRENPEIELRGIAQVMNLKSPHLITIYDVRRNTTDEPFVLMEYVSGPSLRELMIEAPGGLGPQKAAYFIDGIAQGLAYLHDRGIVHRDLKPANIFYDDGYVKIGDYGLSKHISVSRHSGQTVSVGTVHYMAPEIGSGSYTKAIDIYAMGVILYEMLTGHLPFSGSSMGEILMRHLSDRPDLAGVPQPFAAVIAKALAKNPSERYQDAGEMAAALRQFADVSASIASFDHSTLNNAPRRQDASDADQTQTTPHRVPPPPPMDAWAPRDTQPDALSQKLQQKMERISRKLQQRADKLARRGAMRAAERKRRSPEVDQYGAARATRSSRLAQLFVIVALVIGVGAGLGLLHGGRNWDSIAAGLCCCIAASVAGPLVAYFRLLRRSPVRSGLWDRLAYVALTAVMMLPAFGIAGDFASRAAQEGPSRRTSASDAMEWFGGAVQLEIDENHKPHSSGWKPTIQNRSRRLNAGISNESDARRDGRFANMLAAPLAMLLVCDWTRRIRTGRLGEVRARDAIWPGLVGLIASGIAGAGGFQFAAVAVCATASLLTQAGAAIWPVSAARGLEDEVPAPGPGGGQGDVPPVAANRPMAAQPWCAASSMPVAGPQPESSAKLESPIVIDASRSILGRALNKSISVAAKGLLIVGLALAVGQSALLERGSAVAARGEGPGALIAHTADRVPSWALLEIPLAGAVLLVFSRRHDGWMHVLRGWAGGALGLAAAVVALGPASTALGAVFSSNWGDLDWSQCGGPVALTGALLLAAVLLLTWPRRSNTIVV